MSNVLTEKNDGIGFIWINRPEVHNVLNQEIWREVRDAFVLLDNDDEVRVIIVSGKGDKAFVAGSDVKYLRKRTVVQTLDRETPLIVNQIAEIAKPTIAAVNGYALGGGCELALACDIRIASERAKIGQTEINVGVIPGAGGTQRLCRLVGLGKGLELVLTGAALDAREAEKIGLVNKVVPHETLMDEAIKMANQIKSKSPIIARLAKASCKYGYGTDMNTALLVESLYQTIVFGTDDHYEGIDAFLEKREPAFTGK
ncbi:MAG TPA: enoyl-CoA hydratase-related protein [Bacillota bacterium]|nr:enoyl-CoA hydratase-related protein [Bacillota bacterium]HQE67404.1 enoyl-CoA hydratase-related protein [Bacillota bacterium]HQI16211.1 enoyl-CoA hydratase-related protein [Bacillota bacterium]HQL35866.1 enoyl-CoA hydratase-related protein [Bacillota bacterium]